jgi:hypothetical protein
MAELNLTWGGSRKISYVLIKDDICAYRSEILVNGKESIVTEGLAILKEIVNIQTTTPIKNYKITLGKGDYKHIEHLQFCDPKILELWRTTPYGWGNFYEQLDQLCVDTPYTYVQTNGVDSGLLLYVSSWDNRLRTFDNQVLPQATTFNYMNGHIDESTFDLEATLSKLKDRTDLVWFGERCEEVEPAIASIPWYNSQEGRSMHLQFYWRPSGQDWELVRDVVERKDSYSYHSHLLDKVLGIKSLAEKRDNG